MNQHGAVSRMAARLRAVDWTGNDSHTTSRALLLQEYLRRAALWSQALECTDDWPFFDIAARVDPAVRADPSTTAELREHLDEAGAGWYGRRAAVWALHWAALSAAQSNDLPDLPDPFEPLILVFERGGDFSSEHGFFSVDLASFPRRTWRDHMSPTPVVSLDPVTLDRVDTTDPHRSANRP